MRLPGSIHPVNTRRREVLLSVRLSICRSVWFCHHVWLLAFCYAVLGLVADDFVFKFVIVFAFSVFVFVSMLASSLRFMLLAINTMSTE